MSDRVLTLSLFVKPNRSQALMKQEKSGSNIFRFKYFTAQKMNFSVKDFSVNMAKSAGSFGFGQIY